MTKSELGKLPTNEILALFNQATGRTTKKFASRVKGIEQTFRALQANPAKAKAKAEAKPRRSSGMSFRLAPRDEAKTPRAGTKRAKVLEMVGKPDGALFSAIRKACDWDLKDAYEGVRLLNVFCGFGLWHEEVNGTNDYRIWQVDATTFAAKVREANAKA